MKYEIKFSKKAQKDLNDLRKAKSESDIDFISLE